MPFSRKIKTLYTDGACRGNPGPGGWGVVVYFNDGSVYEMGDADPATTNNRMEMQAAIGALKLVTATGQQEPVTLYTDSEYLRNGITKWVKGWKKKGWKTSEGKPVLNKDLWEILDELNSQHIEWRYVRGHAGNEGNERCDEIARAFALGRPPDLQQTQPDALISSQATDSIDRETIQSSDVSSDPPNLGLVMVDSTTPPSLDSLDNLPREVRVAQLRNLIETLHVADEIAAKGYLITSSELADLMDVNASAVTSRGDNWGWRNWVVSRVRREGNQILWQLERVDEVNSNFEASANS
jgi:ribonuclease HI